MSVALLPVCNNRATTRLTLARWIYRLSVVLVSASVLLGNWIPSFSANAASASDSLAQRELVATKVVSGVMFTTACLLRSDTSGYNVYSVPVALPESLSTVSGVTLAASRQRLDAAALGIVKLPDASVRIESSPASGSPLALQSQNTTAPER